MAAGKDTASPHLAWAEDGTPRSRLFDDVYFSRDGGLEESRHTVHVAAKNVWHGLRGIAASLAKFINTLVS